MKNQLLVHLNVHSDYSMMKCRTTIKQLVDKAIKEGQPGMAITDRGNMFGIMEFVRYVNQINKTRKENGENPFKPIIGCELYVAKNGTKDQKQGFKDINGYLVTLLAKNLQGYKNLIKIVSNAWTDGFYVNPRTDRKDLEKYHEGLIVLSGLGSDVHTHASKGNMEDLDNTIRWYQKAFIDDFYIELGKRESVNQVLLHKAKELRVKVSDKNTMEIFDKIESFNICHAPVLPRIEIPTEFNNEEEYLDHLTFSKAKLIYGNPMPEDIVERLKFELEVIKKNDAVRYFLFIHEIVNVAQTELGAVIGPGRSSSAGCLTSYCLGITKIDPLKYNLLFERFMCPDKDSFPDIDLDFDEQGRTRVIEWLEKKYGKECCAHIVSFMTFSIRQADASRAKTVINKKMGIHRCAFIVSDGPVSDWAPVCVQESSDRKGEKVWCTQYEGRFVEATGLIKMDFLDLLILSQRKMICDRIKENQGVELEIEKIPIDDTKTFELFQLGHTENVFQFASERMQQYLRELHPTTFDDLVILNAMYRPGSIEHIPLLIDTKNGNKKITYPIPCMEKYLHETYGIVVYQEQIMMLCRLLAGFSRAESDTLRKALGRKQKDVLVVLKTKFIEGGLRNGHKKATLENIWEGWEEKGPHTFIKAHAVCYTWLSYQMAYLKANYPAEFNVVIASSKNIKL